MRVDARGRRCARRVIAGLRFEFLGEPEAAAAIERAVELSTADPSTRTLDLGGSASTRAAGEAVRAGLAAGRPT